MTLISEKQRDLDLLFNQGNLGLVKTDANGVIEDISHGIEQMLGYGARTLVGTPIWDITYEADLAQDEELMKRIIQDNLDSYHYEKRLISKTAGCPIWIEVNGIVERKNGKIIRYISVLQNVMPLHEGRRRAEIENRDKTALINSTNDYIWSVDTDYNLVNYNESFAKLIQSITGNKTELGYNTSFEFTAFEKDFDRWKGYYEKVKTGKGYSIIEKLDINGQFKFIEITFYPIIENHDLAGISCFGRDITALMNTQTALKSALERIETSTKFTRMALDKLPIGVAVNDMSSGKTTYANNEFGRIYGWEMDALNDVESFFLNVYPDPEYRNYIKEKVLEDIATGDPEKMTWNNIRIRTQNGEDRIVDAKNIPIPEQNLMISTVVDVTDKHHHITTIEGQNEKLKRIAWMQSHEVRSPLAKILGLIDLIKSEESVEKVDQKVFLHLEKATEELDTVVRRINAAAH